MPSKIINLKNFPQLVFEPEKIYGSMDLSEVFAARRDSYLNEFTLFVAHFKAIPNFVHEINVDCKKANNWF